MILHILYDFKKLNISRYILITLYKINYFQIISELYPNHKFLTSPNIFFSNHSFITMAGIRKHVSWLQRKLTIFLKRTNYRSLIRSKMPW
jgi:hypothetical protein